MLGPLKMLGVWTLLMVGVMLCSRRLGSPLDKMRGRATWLQSSAVGSSPWSPHHVAMQLSATETPAPAVIAPRVMWESGIVRSFEPVGHGCDIDSAMFSGKVFYPPGNDARAVCIASLGGGRLDWTKIEAKCTSGGSGSGCTLTVGPEVCSTVPLIVSAATIADGLDSPWPVPDGDEVSSSAAAATIYKSPRMKALTQTAVSTRTVDMAASEIFWIKCGGAVTYTFGINASEAARKIANARRRLVQAEFASRPPNLCTLVVRRACKSTPSPAPPGVAPTMSDVAIRLPRATRSLPSWPCPPPSPTRHVLAGQRLPGRIHAIVAAAGQEAS